MKHRLHLLILWSVACCQCAGPTDQRSAESRIPVILDADANNELDDQHAIAYLLFNQAHFDVKGITVNATRNGGNIDEQHAEAERVMKLCGAANVPLLKGANAGYDSITSGGLTGDYDGKPAVDFIIKAARENTTGKLTLIPIGKLTNIALAINVAPDIKDRVNIIWLGSNYPEKGEYNQVNDTSAMNYLLNQEVPFEMVTVRYGKPSGSDAVRATPAQINEKMKGKGPVVAPVEGRHGGTFTTFGDYAVNLFSKIDLHGDPPSRALFDVVAVAVLKNPSWGQQKEIPAPILIDGQWVERPGNSRSITVWENFDEEAILNDFFETFDKQ